MQDLISQMSAMLIPATVAVLGTLITLLVNRLNAWLKMKAGSDAVSAAGDLVTSTVNELTASVVKDIKARSEDGKLTMSAALHIKDMALARIKKQLPPAVSKSAAAVVADMDEFLRGRIEQAVIEQKAAEGK